MARCAVLRDGDPSHKKDSAWAWIVCLAAATNLAFTHGLIYTFGVLLPVFMDYFKESRENTAWIGSLPLAVSFFFGPFASSLINHFGCRAMSITGCLTCAISFTIASFANDLILLYVTFGVLGAGASCAFISSLEIVSKCFDKRKSIALGIVATGHGLGTMSLSQVLQSLVNVLSWRNSLRIMAGALVLNGLLGLLYDSKIEPASNGEILSSEEDGQRRKSKRRFTFNCSVWKVPRFLVLTACGFFAMFGRSIVYVHLVKYSEDLGMSSSVSSRLIFFLGLNVALGRFACGFLCSLKRLDNWYIYQGVLLVSGVSTMLLTLARHYEELVAYAVVFGFCDGAFATLLYILAFTCVDPSRAASAFGYILMTASMTTMVGPPLSGLTADKLGSYGPTFHMAGGALVAASLPPFVLHCVRNREAKRTELSPIDNENTEDAQEFEKLNRHDGLCMDEPLKITHNDRKPVVVGHELFVSTV